MAKFCRNCGSTLDAQSNFCPSCGKRVESSSKDNKKKRIYIGVAAVLLLGLGFIFYGLHKDEPVKNVVNSNELQVEQSTKEKIPEKRAEEGPVAKAQNILTSNRVQGKVLATSFGNNPNGFLSLVKNNEAYSFILFDQVNQQVAEVPFSLEKYNFPNNRNKQYVPPIIFNMTIFQDKHDRDGENGVWDGENHILPVYALYTFDSNGKVVPGLLNSGRGAKPLHYHNYLMEQKNVDLANLFLLEMRALRESCNLNNVVIPVN